MVEFHMHPIGWKNIINDNTRNTDATKKKFVLKLQRLLEPSTIDELIRVVEADSSGRHPLPKGLPYFASEMHEFSKSVKLNSKEKFQNIINGNHLIELLGLTPSPKFKTILEDCIQAQIDGYINDVASGISYVKGRYSVQR